MSPTSQPLVSIVTPVFNGGRYLAQCIESVLTQTYRHWEYLIVNNCSTDDTLEISNRYARHDRRINVVTNATFVDVIENHNIAFRLISGHSEYCKVVSADDYLYPDCVERLVSLAEHHASVGIVGSYAITDHGIPWSRTPVEKTIFCGPELCRLYLRGDIDPVGAPSSLLYRAALVRSEERFFPGELPNADWSACLRSLETSDFGFVHQVLSYERVHNEALSSEIQKCNGFLIDRLEFLHTYGPRYLSPADIVSQQQELLGELYKTLAVGVINLKSRRYWEFQQARLRAAKCRLSVVRLAAAVAAKLADLLLNPKHTVEKIIRRLMGKAAHSMTRQDVGARSYNLNTTSTKGN